MHVAFNAYFWNQPATGTGQYLRQLVTHLDRLVSDLEITLIYPHADEPQQVPPTVHVHRAPTRAGHLGKVLFEQIAFPRACQVVGADLAHVPHWGSPLHTPLPVVVTIHDLITVRRREYRRRPAARLYSALVAAAAREAAHVIAVSHFSRQEILDHLGIPEERVTAIHSAPAPHFSAQSDLLLDMAVQRKYDLPDLFVLYLGGYLAHKNVPTLLAAYTYVAQALGEEYPLVLAGRRPDGPSPSIPDYDQIIDRAGLEKYVRWLGYVDEEDKPALYRAALCFAFPSRYEGFGFPPLEAMASGVPVVTTDAASLPEVVGDGAFTVDPDDERAMAGAIISLLIQENFAAEMKQKGLAQAARFSWEETATETLLVYDRVVKGGSGA